MIRVKKSHKEESNQEKMEVGENGSRRKWKQGEMEVGEKESRRKWKQEKKEVGEKGSRRKGKKEKMEVGQGECHKGERVNVRKSECEKKLNLMNHCILNSINPLAPCKKQ